MPGASWIAVWPAIGVALVTVFGPGLAIAFAGGARRLQLFALAAPLSFTVAGVTAIVAGWSGLRFGPVAVVVATALLTAIAFVAQRLVRSHERLRHPSLAYQDLSAARPDDPRGRRAHAITLAVGLAIPAVVIGVRTLTAIGAPENIAQLFDNVFHLNAVSLIAATGAGSSLTLGNLTTASAGFYPAAFHDLTALVVGIAGGAPVALNTVTLVLVALVWPVSCVFLATRIFGSRPAVIVAAGVLCTAFSEVPWRMMSFGILYSFLAGLTMLPALLGLLLQFLGVARTRALPAIAAVAAVAGAAIGIALAHPSIVIAALLFSLPFALQRLLRVRADARARGARAAWASAAVVVLYAAAAVAVFVVIRPPLDTAPWNPTASVSDAVNAVIRIAPGYASYNVILRGLAAAGAVGILVYRRWAWPVFGMFAIGGLLFVASASFPLGPERDFLTGVWYRDTERLAAIDAVAAFPLVVAGAVAVIDLVVWIVLRLVVKRHPQAWRAGVVAALAVPLALALVPLTQQSAIARAVELIAGGFAPGPAAALLSLDERTLLGQLDEYVPADEAVVGNPITGASLTEAFAERTAIAPHVFGTRTDAERYLLDHWRDAGSDPAVCPLVRDLHAYWALDFGANGVLGGDGDRLPGTGDLNEGVPPGITRVEQIGQAGLYEATVCRQ